MSYLDMKHKTEKLEVAVIPLSEVLRGNPANRLDSTYFRKENLEADRTLRKGAHGTVLSFAESVSSFGAYALTNDFEYQESGIPFLRCVNIKDGFVSFADCLYIDEEANALLHKSAVSSEMILLTMSGSVGNAAVALPSWRYPLNSNQDIAKIRTKDIDPYYLAAFLGSQYGQIQIERLPVGSVQQHIFLWMIEGILVARTGAVEGRVSDTMKSAYAAREEAITSLQSAERTMLAALGLEGWASADERVYTASASVVRSSGRLDSDYFAPRIRELLGHLGKSRLSIGDVAPSRREKFYPSQSGSFDYIEIGDLTGDGSTTSTKLERADAPSRATWHVHANDIITSTVRPIRRLSALIESTQDNYVCSSGFVVLQPTQVRPEVLLTYLRLPVFCKLMDLHTSASMYPAIADGDLLSLPFLPPGGKAEELVCECVNKARVARAKATKLLKVAREAVELAIDRGEEASLQFLRDAER